MQLKCHLVFQFLPKVWWHCKVYCWELPFSFLLEWLLGHCSWILRTFGGSYHFISFHLSFVSKPAVWVWLLCDLVLLFSLSYSEDFSYLMNLIFLVFFLIIVNYCLWHWFTEKWSPLNSYLYVSQNLLSLHFLKYERQNNRKNLHKYLRFFFWVGPSK